MWELLSGDRDLESVVAAMAEEYDAPEDLVRGDVLALTGALTEAGLLVQGY